MTEKVQLHVRIAPDGTVTAETKGVVGSACLDYVAVLEDLLAATTVDSGYTADYSRTAARQDTEDRNELRQY